MQYGLTLKQLANIRFVFKRFPQIESVVIFGSRAKGNFKPTSDIDIALTGKSLNLNTLSAVTIALDDLMLPYKFDVAIHHQINNIELLDHIERAGQPLFSTPIPQ